MVEYKIPFLVTKGIPLCSLNGLDLTPEKLESFDKILRSRFNMPDNLSMDGKWMNYEWMNKQNLEVLFEQFIFLTKSEMREIMKVCKSAKSFVPVHYILEQVVNCGLGYCWSETLVSNAERQKRMKQLELYLQLDHPPFVYKYIAHGLKNCKLTKSFSRMNGDRNFMMCLDFRPLIYSLIDECDLEAIRDLCHINMFDGKLKYELNDYYKKKFGALIMAFKMYELGLTLDVFLKKNVFEVDQWEVFCSYGFHNVFDPYLLRNVGPEVFKMYTELHMENYRRKC